jgi:hypothetical protein
MNPCKPLGPNGMEETDDKTQKAWGVITDIFLLKK